MICYISYVAYYLFITVPETFNLFEKKTWIFCCEWINQFARHFIFSIITVPRWYSVQLVNRRRLIYYKLLTSNSIRSGIYQPFIFDLNSKLATRAVTRLTCHVGKLLKLCRLSIRFSLSQSKSVFVDSWFRHLLVVYRSNAMFKLAWESVFKFHQKPRQGTNSAENEPSRLQIMN